MFKANLQVKSRSDNPSICAHVCVSDFVCVCESSVYECVKRSEDILQILMNSIPGMGTRAGELRSGCFKA